jgi:hypothetical protein
MPSAKKCARKRTKLKMMWMTKRLQHFSIRESAIHDAIPHKATPVPNSKLTNPKENGAQ